ncbi:MAG: PcfJ domain-containing protein [Candidatus Peribacteria bacterium]|nr:PcfJ domain-containing protein [Candidatus Peribacteria bacterium]
MNRFLKKYGFEEQPGGEGAPSFCVLDLKEHTPEARKLKEQLDYLQQQAPTVMEQLTEVQLTNLRNALLQTQKHHQDPQLHLLYGALHTLQQHQQLVLLDAPFSLKKLYKQTNAFNTQHIKAETAKQYATLLAKALEIDNPIYISDLQAILIDNAVKKRDKRLKAYFLQKHITYDPTIIYNDSYFSELDPNKAPLFITNVNINNKSYQLVSLITKKQMQKESKQLAHCVGRSDFYLEEVRDQKILVLSLRDANGKSQYTIEYNINDQSIEQFRGKNNSLPNEDAIITITLDALTQAGYPITSYVDDLLDKNLISSNGRHQINNKDLTIEYVTNLSLTQTHILKTKDMYTIPATITEKELALFCQIP